MAPKNNNIQPMKGTASVRPTSKDVAKLAKVSRTQVSYVMNDTETNHVSEENRYKILEAARALGYSPNQPARALKKGYSNEFSIFFPAPYPPMINGLIGKIHETGLARNCMPVQYSFNSYKDPQRRLETLTTLLSRRPIGIFCSLIDLEPEEISLIRSKGIDNILLLDIEDHDDITTLVLPSKSVGHIVMEHFLRHGYTEIVIARPFDPVQEKSFQLRLDGMKRALVDAAASNVRLSTIEWPKENTRPTLEHAERFVDRMLSGFSKPIGLYAYSDNYALPILAALLKRGIHIPDEVAVVGTDNSVYGALFQPSLTTISFDTNDLGDSVVALINSLITGDPAETKFTRPLVPTIIERESTKRKGE